ncbi:hypothetical protein FIBSPDRAFT_934160 [Athelia psychrophila]|uniref:Uncharacterized protein n=1 Tax=Athelia psychrophila TaxID=1759441 RepID=A0A166FU74_9AGAM|nr:hypothetical protein FIBSPDRAFT_934160 [Fibularhizoctonia sp. CBS 109695]
MARAEAHEDVGKSDLQEGENGTLSAVGEILVHSGETRIEGGDRSIVMTCKYDSMDIGSSGSRTKLAPILLLETGPSKGFWTEYGQVLDNIAQSGNDVRAAVSSALPKIFTAGIHFAGLADTANFKSPRARRRPNLSHRRSPGRITQIDAYQQKTAALANAFQALCLSLSVHISALLDATKWQAKNNTTKVEDRNALEAHKEDMVAILITFRTRLEQQLDGDRGEGLSLSNRERQFLSKGVTCLRRIWRRTSGLGRWKQMDGALKVLKPDRGVRASSEVVKSFSDTKIASNTTFQMLETEMYTWSTLRRKCCPYWLSGFGVNY